MNLNIHEIIIFLLPSILSFLVSKICPVGNQSGVIIPARPPPIVFGVVWTILYGFIGLAWVLSRRCCEKKFINVLYIILIGLLNLWVINYGCNKDSKSALYVMPFCILVTMILIMYQGNTISSYLLLPLLVWLFFAMLLNYTEVNMTYTSDATNTTVEPFKTLNPNSKYPCFGPAV
jgi:tryptophan-rich sensory protein